ncbi:MAG: 3-oxoacyl-[acyl-carrier-protein] reductase [Simkaniaceae bacterium]|nr:3-oxoacyl-[acyl-carrier-protein] reductase [Simkaniaceae bacterium]
MMLKGQKVLITGGTSGIGREIAAVFAEHGADVAIMGTNPDKGLVAIQEIEKVRENKEQSVIFERVDVSDHQSVKQAVTKLLTDWKGVDVLVNCAGITRDKLLMKMTEDDWDTVIDVNLKSLYNLCHALVRPMMKARRGKIINISSVVGITGNPGQVNYCSSKAGIIGFTQSLAKELAPRGINVNCIAPGFIATPMTDELNDEQKKQILSKIPMAKLGSPRDIANAALFLASNLSDYMTGEVFAVDGGMTA